MAFGYDGSTDYLDLGDISTARFLGANTWTFLTYILIPTFTAGRKSIVSKWGAGAGTRHCNMQMNPSPGDADLEWYVNSGVAEITLSAVIDATDAWFLCCISCDGLDTTGSLTLRVFDADGVQLNSGTGDTNDASDTTEPILLGTENGGAADDYNGHMDWSAYFTREFTENDCRAYSQDPYGTLLQYGADVEFCYRQGYPTTSDAIDLSGKTTATINGTPTVEHGPPVRPMMRRHFGWRGQTAGAAPGGLSIPVAMSSYRRHHQRGH